VSEPVSLIRRLQERRVAEIESQLAKGYPLVEIDGKFINREAAQLAVESIRDAWRRGVPWEPIA
jgi:hypothetical protein